MNPEGFVGVESGHSEYAGISRVMTQITLLFRQNLKAWIRKEIIDFDPYDEQESQQQQSIEVQSAEKSYALTK
jgi:hypothetical protein